MNDTTTGPGQQTDGFEGLDMFALERDARLRDDGFDIPDSMRPDRYVSEMLPWHDDSTDAMRQAAFREWRSRLVQLCLAGVLLASSLFLLPLFYGASITSLWQSAEPPTKDEPAAGPVPESPPGPEASTLAPPAVEAPVVPSLPAAPTGEPLQQEPPPGPVDPPRVPVDPSPSTARSEPLPQLRPSDPPPSPQPRRTNPSAPGRVAGSSSQITRPPLEPPLSQRGVAPAQPADVNPASTGNTASVPPSAPRATEAPSTAAAPAGDRAVPPADRTPAPLAETSASRPASAAPATTPPAAASLATAPPLPPATPAPSPAPVPPPSTAAAAPSPVAAAAAPRATLELDRREINGALARYKGAFNALDARAAAAIWPTVDRDTLSRAFQRLKQQEVSFDDCQIDVKEVRANAMCSGTLRFVPRVGASSPQGGRRQWKFDLAKAGDGWVIQSVDTR